MHQRILLRLALMVLYVRYRKSQRPNAAPSTLPTTGDESLSNPSSRCNSPSIARLRIAVDNRESRVDWCLLFLSIPFDMTQYTEVTSMDWLSLQGRWNLYRSLDGRPAMPNYKRITPAITRTMAVLMAVLIPANNCPTSCPTSCLSLRRGWSLRLR